MKNDFTNVTETPAATETASELMIIGETAEATAIATAEPTVMATAAPSIEATAEATIEATAIATAEVTVEATAIATAEVTAEATAEVTLPAAGGFKFGSAGLWFGFAIAFFLLFAACAAKFVYDYLKKPSAKKPEAAAVGGAAEIGGIGNAHGKGARKYQQDSFGISRMDDERAIARRGVLAIVADGMGGLENSGEISEFVVKRMLSKFAASCEDDARMVLAELIDDVTAGAREKFGASGGTGTTLVAAIIKGGKLYTASVGDSRITLLRGGTPIDINRAHNYGMDLDERVAKGATDKQSAKTHPKRHALTSYIGMSDLKKVDLPENPIRLLAGDKLVLMSDGVYGTLGEAELSALTSGGAAESAENIDRAVQQKKRANQDNYTAIVLEMKGK